MATHTVSGPVSTGRSMYAAIGVGISLVLTALGTFWDFNGNDPGDKSDQGMVEYLITVGMIVVAAAVVFGLVTRASSPTKALVLGILSVLSLVVFWAGLPAVLAAGSLSSAFGSDRLTGASKTGIGLSAVAVALAAVAAFIG